MNFKSIFTGKPKNAVPPSMAGETAAFTNLPPSVIQKPSGKDVSTLIFPAQLQRVRQDVQTWREAVEEKENAWYPQWVKISRLYIDTILNGHVDACMKCRRSLTLVREFNLVNADGKVNEEATKLFQSKWFYDFLAHCVNAQFFGYSLIQIGDIVNGRPTGVSVVKRQNVSPDRLNVTPFVYSTTGFPFNDPTYTIDGNKPYDWTIWCPTFSETGIGNCGMGLLYKVALYEIIMRNLLGFNADYIEMFGQPLRHAKTNKSQDDPERMYLEAALDAMGSRPWIITDPTDEVFFVESKNSNGKNSPYENLEQRCEQKISKIILGHADALDSVPGKLGTDNLNSAASLAMNDIQTEDGRFVQNIVNDLLIPKLQKLGVKIPAGTSFEFSNDREVMEARKKEDENNQIAVNVVKTLKESGFDVDENYISERTGIKLTKSVQPTPVLSPQDQNFSKSMKNKLAKFYG